MTRKEMKNEILKMISKEEFNARYDQLIDWNTATGAIKTIYNEVILTKVEDANEVMHNTFYAIG